MAHYAFIDENNVVIQVITGRDENETVNGVTDWEEYYGQLHSKTCLRTSYNTFAGEHKEGGIPFRKNYAGIGYTYDYDRDAFIPPKDFPSWVLNEETCRWDAPVDYPTDGKRYDWDEEQLAWIED